MGRQIEYDNAYTHKVTEDAINGVVQCDGAGNYSAATLYTLPSLLSVANIQVTNINGSAYPDNVAFGNWSYVSSLPSYSYQASADGFVHVVLEEGGSESTGYVIGYTDDSNPPTTKRSGAGVHNGGSPNHTLDINGFTMAVKKNDYWKVGDSGTYSNLQINWIPQS